MKTEIVTLIACCLLVVTLVTLFWGGALLERRLNRSLRERFDRSAKRK